jgi:lipopolysaccharide/colanic/teichoic acid biosynthesis glycosyltransferase
VAAVPALMVVGAAALAVKLETPGPALFAQTRVGLDGRRFRMWKVRTMVANASALEPELQHLNELPWPDFKIARDPRVTRVGRWLRRTSIDELPQIWNVARGEMSWVGPRPTPFGLERYRAWHGERLEALPGRSWREPHATLTSGRGWTLPMCAMPACVWI